MMDKRRMLLMMGGGDTINETQTTYKGSAIYGISWAKTDTPLTRINASVGMVAAAGVDAGAVTNNFDTAEIFSEFTEETDAGSNVFIRIPKFYIRKTDTATKKTWQICKKKMPGSYLPWCFWDFTNGVPLDYVDVGKYSASLSGANKLESLSGKYPLINKNIVDYRTYAQANGAGYQQLDIHTYDMLQVLFLIEFAKLDSQSIMSGWTSGTYGATELLTADTSPAGNVAIVSNATGAKFAVGQPISIGTSQGGNQRFYGRNITQIDVDTPGAGSTTITFDGAAVALATGDYLYNVGWKNGFSSGISASSGSLSHNTNGKNPFHYRGIENLYGNVWQFVDGININENQTWYCKNQADFASNLFASPYIQLGYVNKNANGYVKFMGYDAANPMVELPINVDANYYKDYYFQSTGQRIAVVGGNWAHGGDAGLFYWALNNSSANAHIRIGGRLLKKAL